MRILMRTCLVALLTGSLAVSPAVAAPAQPLGSVVYADHARLGVASAMGGATVFSGDQLSTEPTGTLRVHLGGGQIYLLPSSTVAVREISGRVGAELLQGTVGFSSTGDSPLVVQVGEAIIRPKSEGPTHARVDRVNAKELVVSSYRGPVEVVVGTETHTIAEATAARVLIAPDSQGPQGSGAGAGRRQRAVLIAVGLIAAAAIIGIVAWRASISAEGP